MSNFEEKLTRGLHKEKKYLREPHLELKVCLTIMESIIIDTGRTNTSCGPHAARGTRFWDPWFKSFVWRWKVFHYVLESTNLVAPNCFPFTGFIDKLQINVRVVFFNKNRDFHSPSFLWNKFLKRFWSKTKDTWTKLIKRGKTNIPEKCV